MLFWDVRMPDVDSLSRLGWYTSLAMMWSGFVTCWVKQTRTNTDVDKYGSDTDADTDTGTIR